jgi:hypothetical protein
MSEYIYIFKIGTPARIECDGNKIIIYKAYVNDTKPKAKGNK